MGFRQAEKKDRCGLCRCGAVSQSTDESNFWCEGCGFQWNKKTGSGSFGATKYFLNKNKKWEKE